VKKRFNILLESKNKKRRNIVNDKPKLNQKNLSIYLKKQAKNVYQSDKRNAFSFLL